MSEQVKSKWNIPEGEFCVYGTVSVFCQVVFLRHFLAITLPLVSRLINQ